MAGSIRKRGRPADPQNDYLMLKMALHCLKHGRPDDHYALAAQVVHSNRIPTLERRRLINNLRNRWRCPESRERFLRAARSQGADYNRIILRAIPAPDAEARARKPTPEQLQELLTSVVAINEMTAGFRRNLQQIGKEVARIFQNIPSMSTA